jgi:hypothetical protein
VTAAPTTLAEIDEAVARDEAQLALLRERRERRLASEPRPA